MKDGAVVVELGAAEGAAGGEEFFEGAVAADEGLLELDFRQSGECELAFFGVTGREIGTGAGRWLMNRAIEQAWAHPIRRFWVHTCTLDHAGALAFYVRSGFVPYRRQIEIADGQDYRMPATIDDPTILDEITQALQSLGLAGAQG